MKSIRRHLTPPEIAARFQIGVEKVHAWIKCGELRACNLATKASGRPRYIVAECDLETFLASRAVKPRTAVKSTRRTRPAGDTIEFF
jgi:hypothetical protein